jgi:hypothetical protein
MKPTPEDRPAASDKDGNTRWTYESVAEALRGLRFGVVILTVQDGVVVQIERTERKRYQRPAEEG